MRKLALMLIFSILACPTWAFAQAKPKLFKIAILEFDPVTTEAEKENLGRVSAEFLITAAVNSGSFGVVERAALKKVLDEMQFGQGSHSPGTAAQAIGSMVGAQGVLTGSVAKTGNSVRLDARLIDVVSGNIVAARSAYAKSDLRSMATAAELLIGQLEGDLSRLTPAEPRQENSQVTPVEAKPGDKSQENQGDVVQGKQPDSQTQKP